jgi:hypothetical protein
VTRHINVILAVSDYFLVGSIPATGARIQDIVARDDSDYVTLNRAHVLHDALLDSPLATLGELQIDKERIAFIGMLQEKHEAPLKRFNNFQAKFTANVYLIIENYRIEGTVYLPSETRNVAQTLNSVSNRFVAVTHASVYSAQGKRVELPLALVNHRRATAVGVPWHTNNKPHEQSQGQASNVEIGENAVLRACDDMKNFLDAQDTILIKDSDRGTPRSPAMVN